MIILSTYALIYSAKTPTNTANIITKMQNSRKVNGKEWMKDIVLQVLQRSEIWSSLWPFSSCHRCIWNRTTNLQYFLCKLLLVCAHISIGYWFFQESDETESTDSLVLSTISISVQAITHFLKNYIHACMQFTWTFLLHCIWELEELTLSLGLEFFLGLWASWEPAFLNSLA